MPFLVLRSVHFFFHMFFLLKYSNALEEDDFRWAARSLEPAMRPHSVPRSHEQNNPQRSARSAGRPHARREYLVARIARPAGMSARRKPQLFMMLDMSPRPVLGRNNTADYAYFLLLGATLLTAVSERVMQRTPVVQRCAMYTVAFMTAFRSATHWHCYALAVLLPKPRCAPS